MQHMNRIFDDMKTTREKICEWGHSNFRITYYFISISFCNFSFRAFIRRPVAAESVSERPVISGSEDKLQDRSSAVTMGTSCPEPGLLLAVPVRLPGRGLSMSS